MSILLINPSLENIRVAVGVGFPVGLAHIAASLEKASYSVFVFDLPVENLSLERIIKKIKHLKPKVVGITSMTSTFLTAARIAEKIAEVFPEILIVFGGVHVSFLDKQTLKDFDFIDLVVRGEGEETIREVVKRYLLKNNHDFKGIKGITYKHKGKIFRNPDRERVKNSSLLYPPAYHLFPMHLYSKRQLGEFGETFSPIRVLTARGCPYSCVFCLVPVIFKKKCRCKTVKSILDELQLLHDKFGIKNFKFADDTFTLDQSRVIAICEGMKKRKLNMNWECETRVDLVSSRVLKAMKSANCTTVWYGIESSSPGTIRKVNKKISLPMAANAIKVTQECGLRAGAFFIMGLPSDGPRQTKCFVNWAIKADLDAVVFSILTPFPGTKIFKDPKKFGILIRSQDWNRYTESDAVIETRYLTASAIKKYTIRSYLDFYCRTEYLLARDIKWRFNLTRHVLGFVESSSF